MVSQFESGASNCAGFNKFRLSAEAMWRIVQAGSLSERSAAFDLDVRAQISHLTFQMPDRIADAIRYTSDVQLWKEVARHENPGATPAELNHHQATLKTQLSSMVERRNKIAHEGDLGPTVPRQTLPISLDQLVLVRTVVKRLVDSIEAVVDAHDAEILAASAVAEASEAGEQAGVPAASDDAPNELQDSPSESPNSADAPIEPVWIEPSGGGEPGGQQA
ncbi:hypothetical protein R1G70_13025 [Stenotrophomonas sp. C960]|uniref:hypothetical protein n=1 Tax=unclassified Stenotrophomonas TaxID=196198 RepID=UPI00293CAE7E|nr:MULTISPECIES: hypothetical protein [unclassified Stenotrophomonas]MDV3465579.1 hypothetical protein [Stenotrophomonas sp. C960]MDV3532428.1 hypothetical protein [Stenotrophomonas sp. C2866]